MTGTSDVTALAAETLALGVDPMPICPTISLLRGRSP